VSASSNPAFRTTSRLAPTEGAHAKTFVPDLSICSTASCADCRTDRYPEDASRRSRASDLSSVRQAGLLPARMAISEKVEK
jgi:hypothetical protein